MTAYVDDAAILFKGKPRFHLTADSLEELHLFASECGINRCWYHRGTRHPHYDVTAEQRQVATSRGAVAVTSRELLKRAKLLASQPRLPALP
ncbi:MULTISPECIES: DUF4031 domain-containing protein [unclassified Variovorax]|uniref:DUF4031 domain-containing protein n=1 Tax=unclassified Variovorax TaxID=663243 RepID=UPI00076D6613|nr:MULTISPECIES: DUF4031 domain-containing protein [unclassified Variovorax]KWT95518.1 hypothetical protein APY03_2395 [Variovorax sp. WDL1]PNG50118.1 hypothetical protein CHC06_05741 [Variovorax sp. B2]PNG50991.1 hypothetical protein CHC07_05647 [Variovorax sp. B4]VTV17154.1 hypothetical protein WDL1P1_00156 [Variovorax sp. WDL1]